MNSRKVIVVLSKEYLADSCHMFELDVALKAMYDQHIEEIIVVYIARGLPERKIPKMLANTMRRHQVIEWSEEEDARQLFKRKLIDRLMVNADAANIDAD